MGERPRLVRTVATWAGPVVLVAAAAVAGRLSVRLAPGGFSGRTQFSTPALDLLMYGLVVAGWVACFVWRVSALLTAAGSIWVLWYYAELYMGKSTDPLGGLVYFMNVPLAVVSGGCGLIGFFGRPARSEAAHAPTQTGEGAVGRSSE